jgi:hypothetical protein
MKEEGRRKKEEGRRRFIYVDSDLNSKRKTLRTVGVLTRTVRINNTSYNLSWGTDTLHPLEPKRQK